MSARGVGSGGFWRVLAGSGGFKATAVVVAASDVRRDGPITVGALSKIKLKIERKSSHL